MKTDKTMERAQAARAYIDTKGVHVQTDSLELEAFMAIFHPGRTLVDTVPADVFHALHVQKPK